MSDVFDYQPLAQRLGIPTEALAKLEDCVRSQYGSDQMMFELRMIRTLEAIAQGAATLEQAILEFATNPMRAMSGSAGAGHVCLSAPAKADKPPDLPTSTWESPTTPLTTENPPPSSRRCFEAL